MLPLCAALPPQRAADKFPRVASLPSLPALAAAGRVVLRCGQHHAAAAATAMTTTITEARTS